MVKDFTIGLPSLIRKDLGIDISEFVIKSFPHPSLSYPGASVTYLNWVASDLFGNPFSHSVAHSKSLDSSVTYSFSDNRVVMNVCVAFGLQKPFEVQRPYDSPLPAIPYVLPDFANLYKILKPSFSHD